MSADAFQAYAGLFSEPWLLMSRDGAILDLNAAATELCQRDREEIRGRPLVDFVADPPGRIRECLSLWAGARQAQIDTLSWRRLDGAVELDCEVSAVGEQESSAILLRCRPEGAANRGDLTNWKRAQEEREALLASERAARSDAERASRMKDEFLATLSHELRTPLNAVLGWAQIVSRPDATPADIAEGVETIARNARVQARIIDDLLDMSRIISGKARLDVKRVDLAAIVNEAVESVQPSARTKGIRLVTVLDGSVGPMPGDADRLRQIAWNLLSNAIKFTPRGGRVQVVIARSDAHVELTITDTGQGISAEFLPHVFDRFRQEDATVTRRFGGLGIGLSIVRYLTELHGRTVRARSAGLGQGAAFTVQLPIGAAGELYDETSFAAMDDSVQACLTGKKILVVDDEPDARSLLRRILTECDADVTTAASTAEALKSLDARVPDLMVSDIGMPEADGYELLRRVRERSPKEGGAVPAVALTAFARPEDRRRAMLAGYHMHVTKPVEPVELISVLSKVLQQTADVNQG